MDYTVTNSYTVKDDYNSSIIVEAIMRALDCIVNFEKVMDNFIEVTITCDESIVPTIELMLSTIAI